ncbi:MAG TPA: HAD family hydrolase [Albitalea sp.]|nr:HAD family hydrolase [Albitalea sp.]
MSAIFPGLDSMSDPARLARAVFIDKDGTLVADVPHNVDPAQLRFTPHALEGLKLLADAGYLLIVVTNQPGIARGLFTRAQLTRLQHALADMMAREGVPLTDFYACPHAPGPAGPVPGCLCRKPAPGLLRQAARAHQIDLARSWMIGDILDDVEAGRRAGCRSVLLDVGSETVWRISPLRTPQLRAGNLLDAARAILAADEDCVERETSPLAAQPQPEPNEAQRSALGGVARAASLLHTAMLRARASQPGSPS